MVYEEFFIINSANADGTKEWVVSFTEMIPVVGFSSNLYDAIDNFIFDLRKFCKAMDSFNLNVPGLKLKGVYDWANSMDDDEMVEFLKECHRFYQNT